MGYSGLLVPEEFGGSALGAVEAGVLMEAIGAHLCTSPLLSSGIVAASALLRAGSREQQAHWLPRIARAEVIATLAADERAKHRPELIALAATRLGDGFSLEGSKTFVVDGHVADLLIVAARTAGDVDDTHGITLFLVEAGARRLTVERTPMVDTHNAARVRFDGVELPASACLGPLHGGWPAYRAALDAGRAAAAAELLGIADEVFARTNAFLKERRQFGRPIGEFQGLQHRAAMLYVDLELARAALMKALNALDSGGDASAAVAVAKAKCGNAATLAVQEGVQMHGGMGMTDEFDSGLFMKRARVLQELFGDAAFHMDRLATLRGY
jgi:alkylation response protein AidB-like acyl-CoA dehydrogenase